MDWNGGNDQIIIPYILRYSIWQHHSLSSAHTAHLVLLIQIMHNKIKHFLNWWITSWLLLCLLEYFIMPLTKLVKHKLTNYISAARTTIANLNTLGLEIDKVSLIIPTAILQSMKLRDYPRSLLPALSMHLIGERTATIPLHHFSLIEKENIK